MNGRDAAALAAIVSISRALSGGADLAAILGLVAKQGRALVSARAAVIEVQEAGRMVVAAIAGDLPEGLETAREGSTVMEAPLTLRGRTYGALVAVDRQGEDSRFTIEDEELLEALAALAASGVAAQRFIRAQRPVVLDHVGLAGAIELLADLVESPNLEIRIGLDLSFEEGRARDRLDQEVETALYAIAQEALDNAAKHAGASRVVIEVVEDDELEEVRVEVRDDGEGFDPAKEGKGLGFAGMRERAELLGGSLEIQASPGAGTRVSAALPSGRGGRSMLSID